nr:hypothetical protein [Tanacetum cinerariifolium]
MFQHLGRYPISVRVFSDPVLFLAGLQSLWEHGQNFVYAEDEEDLSFLPKEPSLGFGTGSPSMSVNIEILRADEEPVLQPAKVTADSGGSPKLELFVVHLGSVATRIKDKKCKTRGGSSRPPVKRKLASGSLNSHATHAKTSTSKDDVLFFDKLLDLHDRCYARHAIIDNAVNRRSCELLEVIEKLRGECDVIKERKRAWEEESLSQANKAQLEAVKVSLQKEVDDVKWDTMKAVSKVVPNAVMKLIYSDDLGSLVGRLVSFAIIYGRCKAFEQVAAIKEPFDLSKVKGYRPSYKKEHDQAGNDVATATFPWLLEFVADPSAMLKSSCQ